MIVNGIIAGWPLRLGAPYNGAIVTGRPHLLLALAAVALGAVGLACGLGGGCGPGRQGAEDAGDGAADGDAGGPDGGDGDAGPEDGGWPLLVWAPGAAGVAAVRGEGAGESRCELDPSDDGHFGGEVAWLSAGDPYRLAVSHDGLTVERLDPRSLAVSADGRSSVAARPEREWAAAEAGFRRPALRDAVIYELHVGTFAATPSAPGTFESALGRLDHLAELGVNAIELMPVHEFPGERSWGYNPSHLFAVEDAYGGPEGLATLVLEAHARGIAVLVDVVYNHMASANALCDFVGDAPDERCGGPYFWPGEEGWTDWGPRPDFAAEGVRRLIRDNVLGWVEVFHVDGFRFDSTSNIWSTENGEGTPLTAGRLLLGWLNRQIDDVGGGRLSIAEDFHGGDAVTRPAATGEAPEEAGMGFDAQWDGWLHWELHRFAVDGAGDLSALSEALRHRWNGDPFQRVVYTESHDTTGALNGHARLPEEIDPEAPGGWLARKRSTLAAAILLTAPGVPMLLQGQDMLQAGAFHDTAPLDWSNLDRFAGIVRLYRDIIALRRDLRGCTAGLEGPNVAVQDPPAGRALLVYRRWDRGGPGDDVVVVANLSAEPAEGLGVGLPAPGAWQVRLDTDDRAYSPDFGGPAAASYAATSDPRGGEPCSAAVSVGPWSAIVLSQDR